MEAAKLALEFWTQICEVELERQKMCQQHHSLIYQAHQSLLSIFFQGILKNKDEEVDDLKDAGGNQEWTVALAAGCAIEHMARLVQDDILTPVLSFVQERLQSPDWVERYLGSIALGAIVEGPNPQSYASILAQSFSSILLMMDDPSLKVKYGISWVMRRVAQFVPVLIFQGQQVTDLFIGKIVEHMGDHINIST